LNFKNSDVRFRQIFHAIRKSTALFVVSDTSSSFVPMEQLWDIMVGNSRSTEGKCLSTKNRNPTQTSVISGQLVTTWGKARPEN